MTMYKNWSAPASFIFDWNKRLEEFSLYRITKEIVSIESNCVPRYLQSLRSSGIQEKLEYCSGLDFKTIKSGRWHWKGMVSGTWDYWGEFEEEWCEKSLTRIN